MVVSGISGLLLPFLLSLPSLGLTTLGTDVDGWGGLYHDGAAAATDGPLLRRTPASNLLQEPPDGGPDRLHHPFIARRMALRPAAVFIGGGFTLPPAARAAESPRRVRCCQALTQTARVHGDRPRAAVTA